MAGLTAKALPSPTPMPLKPAGAVSPLMYNPPGRGRTLDGALFLARDFVPSLARKGGTCPEAGHSMGLYQESKSFSLSHCLFKNLLI